MSTEGTQPTENPSEQIKMTIFKRGMKSIPNFVWAFCASYALIMFTNLFVLNFAHIDANKHIERYLDIQFSRAESARPITTDIECYQCSVSELNERLIKLEELSHPAKGK